MKVWIAKDWRGIHIYKDEPRFLEHLPAFPPTWSGHELKYLQPSEDLIDLNKCEERELWWSLVKIYE